MAVAADDSITFMDYVLPGRLVCADWLARRLEEGVVGNRDLVVRESDEDVLLYDTGHIEGALKVDWHTDLNDPVTRDLPATTAVDYHLLGFDKVRNDDGSWTEWGNAVWVPNEVGAT